MARSTLYSRNKDHSHGLGFPTIALAILITSFFYVLPLGRYAVAGINTDYRIYDFAFLAFLFLVGLPQLTRLRLQLRNTHHFHYWAMVLLFLIGISLVITALFGGVNRLLPAMIRTFRFGYYFVTAGFITTIIDTPERYRFLLKVLYLNVVVQMMLAFAQGVGWLPNFWPAYWLDAYGDTPVGTLSPHHKQIGIVMLMGITLTMTFLRTTQNLMWRILLVVALAGMIMVPIFVGSRTAWLGFITLGLAYLHMHRGRGVGAIVVVMIAVAGIFWYSQDLVGDPLQEQIQARLIADIESGGVVELGTGRDDIYLKKIPAGIARYPWVLLVGAGFQNAATVIPGASAAHNNYLQALLELGFFGLFIYLRFLVTVLRNLRETAATTSSPQEKIVAQDAWAFFVAVMVTMLVGESLWAQYSMFTLTGQIMAFVALAMAPLNWASQPDAAAAAALTPQGVRRYRYGRMASTRPVPAWRIRQQAQRR